MSRPASLVLDSGAISAYAQSDSTVRTRMRTLRQQGYWPPSVPTAVLVECLRGRPDYDASTNAILKSFDVRTRLPLELARYAAALRARAGRGSAVDAILVATADPGGVVVTGDPDDLRALASQAQDVTVVAIRQPRHYVRSMISRVGPKPNEG